MARSCPRFSKVFHRSNKYNGAAGAVDGGGGGAYAASSMAVARMWHGVVGTFMIITDEGFIGFT